MGGRMLVKRTFVGVLLLFASAAHEPSPAQCLMPAAPG
jgi:hypothetical protein